MLSKRWPSRSNPGGGYDGRLDTAFSIQAAAEQMTTDIIDLTRGLMPIDQGAARSKQGAQCAREILRIYDALLDLERRALDLEYKADAAVWALQESEEEEEAPS